jgi:adenylate kinase
MHFDTIFIIGPQGSGKGTQARVLAEKHNLFYWEMGAVLRNLATEPTPLGKQVKQLIDSGVLLTDDLLLSVVKERMGTIPLDQGVIFDGVPRRIGQAEFLMDFLRGQGRKNIVTLFIDVPHDESLNRLLLRAEKEGRKDDTREAIEYRLQQYEQDTVPVLDYLRQNSHFITIDGQPPVPEVTASINKALEEYAQA